MYQFTKPVTSIVRRNLSFKSVIRSPFPFKTKVYDSLLIKQSVNNKWCYTSKIEIFNGVKFSTTCSSCVEKLNKSKLIHPLDQPGVCEIVRKNCTSLTQQQSSNNLSTYTSSKKVGKFLFLNSIFCFAIMEYELMILFMNEEYFSKPINIE